MNPVLSVIVPVYGAERSLPRCIERILAQSFTDFELLLVDDGSPDRSGAICDEYARKDTRVRVFHTENKGASSARNTGLDHAAGKYICFADADDYAGGNWLSIFLCAEEPADLTIQSFYECDASGVRKQENEKAGVCSFPEFEERILDLEEKGFGYVWCKMFKNEIIRNRHLRFDTRYRLCEDLEFVYRYLQYVRTIRVASEGDYYYQLPEDGQKKYEGRVHAACYLSIYHYSRRIVSRPEVLDYLKKRSAECAAYDLIDAYLNKKYRYAYKQLLAFSREMEDISEISFPLIDVRLFKYFYRSNHIRWSHRMYCFLYSLFRVAKSL